MAFKLPELPFAKNAFGNFISEEGFEYHHGKHHAAYVNKLNANTNDTSMADMELNAVVKKSFIDNNPAVYNNAAQHFNHSFFWNCMSPNGGGAPTGKIADLINSSFGSFDDFKKQFSDAAATLFGSGWAWLVESNGKLELLKMSNAGTPLTEDNKKPILTLDVWEHAYYIDHRNARPKFIEMFWDVVNWEYANKQLA